MSLYELFTSFQDYDWVEYGFILCLILFFVTQILQPSWFFFIGLLIALPLIYVRAEQKKNTISTKNKELMVRLKTLYPKPANFHMDPDIINLFYNVRDFRTLNSESYDQCLIAVDNMLKIVSELEQGVYHCGENLDIVRDQMNKAMNHMHTIVYRLPVPKITVIKHQKALKALHIILRRHVDNMVDICQRQYKNRGIDINTHFVYNDGPRAHDKEANSSQAETTFHMYV